MIGLAPLNEVTDLSLHLASEPHLVPEQPT